MDILFSLNFLIENLKTKKNISIDKEIEQNKLKNAFFISFISQKYIMTNIIKQINSVSKNIAILLFITS